jgi:hypothetical protein
MTREDWHLFLLSWQPKWLANLPTPLREGLAGLLLLPALLWIPIAPLLSLAGFLVVSGVYEYSLTGPKVSDTLWRGIGAGLVYVGWTLCQ